MYGDDPENVFYYLTIYNEPYVQPAEPEGLDVEDLLRGMYLYAPAADLPEGAPGRSCWRPASRCTGRSRRSGCCATTGACTPTCGR